MGGVYFEAPRGRNFIRPPPSVHPPPLEGYFQGWGGGGVQNLALYDIVVLMSLSASARRRVLSFGHAWLSVPSIKGGPCIRPQRKFKLHAATTTPFYPVKKTPPQY